VCLVVCRDGQKGNEDVVFFYFSGWTEKIMRKSGRGGESQPEVEHGRGRAF
jgi:hypothetical protein